MPSKRPGVQALAGLRAALRDLWHVEGGAADALKDHFQHASLGRQGSGNAEGELEVAARGIAGLEGGSGEGESPGFLRG